MEGRARHLGQDSRCEHGDEKVGHGCLQGLDARVRKDRGRVGEGLLQLCIRHDMSARPLVERQARTCVFSNSEGVLHDDVAVLDSRAGVCRGEHDDQPQSFLVEPEDFRPTWHFAISIEHLSKTKQSASRKRQLTQA